MMWGVGLSQEIPMEVVVRDVPGGGWGAGGGGAAPRGGAGPALARPRRGRGRGLKRRRLPLDSEETPPRLGAPSFGPRASSREHAMRVHVPPTRRQRARSRELTRASDVTRLLCCYVPSVRLWTSAVSFVPEALTLSRTLTAYRGFCAHIDVGCVKISGEWERRAVVRLRLVWPHYFRNTYAVIRSTVLERSKHYNNKIHI